MAENLSAIVKLKGAMPPSDRANGVHLLAPQLTAEPSSVLYVVAVLDVDKIEDKIIHEDGEIWHERTPVLKVREIEVMRGDDAEHAEMMIIRSRGKRQGGTQGTLPFDLRTGGEQ
jgi:hypothetical protein